MRNEKKLNADEALALIRKRFPQSRIAGCAEYDEYYVFALEPQSVKPDERRQHIGNGQKMNRFTGEITHFFPPTDGWENFKNGKTIIP